MRGEGSNDSRNRRNKIKIQQATQIAGKAIEELNHALEAGHSEKLRKYLAAKARFHRYSLPHITLIAAQRPIAIRGAGFHTWKRTGRFVKKHAKGIGTTTNGRLPEKNRIHQAVRCKSFEL